MTHFDIDAFLSGHAWGFVFVFARIGSILMLFPGLSESYVSVRTRLMFALMISFLMLEPLMPRLPAAPADLIQMTRLLSYEIIMGLFYGTLLRIMVGTLEACGTVIALQSGLSNAQVLNPAVATQSTLPSALLSVIGVTLLFISGLDLALFRSLSTIYVVFPPGGEIMTGDIAQTVMHMINTSFVTGVELAMPFFVIGLLFNTVLGIMQKLMPSVQLFMVAMPAQVWGGLTMLALTIGGIMTLWMKYIETSLNSLLSQ